ncbi:hypothetical protein M404DRAFT_1001826, partial [Pisolithus tinctorius Marx 270]
VWAPNVSRKGNGLYTHVPLWRHRRNIPVALSSLGGGRKHSGSSQADITKLRTPIPP